MIALLSVLCGGEGCADMERFGRAKEPFLRRFMVLAHGIPSHDAFSDLFNALDPGVRIPTYLTVIPAVLDRGSYDI